MRFDATVLAIVAATAVAALDAPARAEPAIPAHKQSSDGYPDAARRDFIEAQIAERGGNIATALSKYGASNAKSPQANTWFNMARLELQLDRVRDARSHFQKYLEAAPNAADRAAITKLVAQLETADPIVTIGGRLDGALDAEPAAVIVLDGVRVGTSPVTLTVKPGRHDVERFTATTYDRTSFSVKAGDRTYVDLRGRKQPGNVLLAGLPGNRTWTEGEAELATGRRFALAPGHYSIRGTRGGNLPLTCKPIELDITATTHITYVWIELADQAAGATCRDVRKVKVVKLEAGL